MTEKISQSLRSFEMTHNNDTHDNDTHNMTYNEKISQPLGFLEMTYYIDI